jgi:hypothetical protein
MLEFYHNSPCAYNSEAIDRLYPKSAGFTVARPRRRLKIPAQQAAHGQQTPRISGRLELMIGPGRTFRLGPTPGAKMKKGILPRFSSRLFRPAKQTQIATAPPANVGPGLRCPANGANHIVIGRIVGHRHHASWR